MQYIRFEIERIMSGWFDVSFQSTNEKTAISASDVWGNDSPKMFLKTLIEVYQEDDIRRYVIWDEEPGIYIISFDKAQNKTRMIIGYSEHDQEFYKEFNNITGNIPFEEFKKKLPDLEVLFDVADIDLNYFIKAIYERFCECNIEEYQDNWMDYPYSELSKIKEIIIE